MTKGPFVMHCLRYIVNSAVLRHRMNGGNMRPKYMPYVNCFKYIGVEREEGVLPLLPGSIIDPFPFRQKGLFRLCVLRLRTKGHLYDISRQGT